MSYIDGQWGIYPPFGDPDAPGQRTSQRLAGTGTAESVNESSLVPGRNYALHVGAAPIRVSFRINKDYGGAAVSATGGTVIPANSVYIFKAIRGRDDLYGSLYVHAEAADGVAAYECSIYQRD